MHTETERKFTVDHELLESSGCLQDHGVLSYGLAQGYLWNSRRCSVRVRFRSDRGYYFTAKCPSSGISRKELEFKIPSIIGRLLLRVTPSVIHKTRIEIPAENGLMWEIDKFHNIGDGFMLAEIELPSYDFSFKIPDWIITEVSHDPNFYNSVLSKRVI